MENAACRHDQRTAESQIAQCFGRFLVEIKIIRRPPLRGHPWIPRAHSLRIFAGHFFRLCIRIVRVGVCARRFRLQCLRQIQPAVSVDEPGINRFPRQVPDARFRRHSHVRPDFDDDPVADQHRSFLDRLARRCDDARICQRMNPRIVLANSLLRNSGDLRGTGDRQNKTDHPQTPRPFHDRSCRLTGRARETSSRFWITASRWTRSELRKSRRDSERSQSSRPAKQSAAAFRVAGRFRRTGS